ncbi:MAG: glycosyltransferase family 4 protein [Patescibacteria group bacterium]
MHIAKRRILFLITTSDWGGAQNFVFNMAREAKKQGFDVMVAAGESGELGARCEQIGINYRKVKTIKRKLTPFHDLAALYEIRSLIREFRPHIVHLNSSKMGVLGALAANLEKVPRIIYRIGGWAFLEDLGKIKHWIYLWSEKWSAPKKDIIVTVHPGDEELAKKYNFRPRDRIITIPNGIDLAQFDSELLTRDVARQKLDLGVNDLVIGTIANYYPAKNIPWYLECISEIENQKSEIGQGSRIPNTEYRIPNVRFVIIGDGPDNNLVRNKYEELNLDNRVILTGRRADARSLLKAFDIFVLPSSKEGMPWTLLEAMAASLPCIATDVGACRWMLEPDAGIVIQSKDKAALLHAINDLISNKEKQELLGETARHAVETRFRWETAARNTLMLFE